MINYIKSIFLLLKNANKEIKYIMLFMISFIFIFLSIIFWNPIYDLIAIIWILIVYIAIIIKDTDIIKRINEQKRELDKKDGKLRSKTILIKDLYEIEDSDKEKIELINNRISKLNIPYKEFNDIEKAFFYYQAKIRLRHYFKKKGIKVEEELKKSIKREREYLTDEFYGREFKNWIDISENITKEYMDKIHINKK